MAIAETPAIIRNWTGFSDSDINWSRKSRWSKDSRDAPVADITSQKSRLRGGLPMYALRLMLKRIPQGWAVALSDGRELVRFRGLFAKRRALQYLATAAGSGH